jgi:uncharacterized membrane protein
VNRKPLLWATLAALAVMAGLSLWAAPDLPSRVPMHFDVRGTPDRLGSRAEALAGIPLLTAGLGALLYGLPLIDPRRENLARSARAYNALGIALEVFLTVVHAALLLNGLGTPVAIERVVPAAIGLLFLLLGNYLGKTRSNWFFGIRTPWTLSSERVWARTHRLGGRLFAGLGAAIVLVALFAPPEVTLFLTGAGAAAVAVITVLYSHLAWRADPARTGQA